MGEKTMGEKTIFKTRSFERFGFIEGGNAPEVTWVSWACLNELAKYNKITYLGNLPDDKQESLFALFTITKENDVLQYYCVELHKQVTRGSVERS